MGRFGEAYLKKLELFRARQTVDLVSNIPTYADPSITSGVDAVVVPLTKGQHALVDLADEPMVRQYHWFAKLDDWGHWYAHRETPRDSDGHRRRIAMHRFILGVEDRSQFVDHKNGDGLDNRRCNLRICNNKQNTRNARMYTGKKTSFYKGVSFITSLGKFRAQIMCSGVKINLGNFDDPKEAALAYDTAARKLFGEFARVNFPLEAA